MRVDVKDGRKPGMMSFRAGTVEDDLAFFKSIVSETSSGFGAGGFLYASAGMLYGLQCVFLWLHTSGIMTFPGTVLLAAGTLPTVIFLLLCVWAGIRDRKQASPQGATSRAIMAAFISAGIANGILSAVFGVTAAARQDFSIWLLFPVVVCALQGAAWFVIGFVRRKLWMSGISAGWYGTALVTGLLIPQPSHYNLVLGLALFAFMAAPGFVMMRINHDERKA